MADDFMSKFAIKAEDGYDVSKLKGKSVVITGGIHQQLVFARTALTLFQVQVDWAKSSRGILRRPGIYERSNVRSTSDLRQRVRYHWRPVQRAWD
jgi:hypothetical protein